MTKDVMKCKVTIGDIVKEYTKGLTYETIAKEWQSEYPYPILLVMVDGKLQELAKTVDRDCTIQFVDATHPAGLATYRRSMSLLLVKAVQDVGGEERLHVRIHFSISKGFFCTIKEKEQVDNEFLQQVEDRMRVLVEEKVPIFKETMPTDDAMEIFRDQEMFDKENLFRYRRISGVNVYSMGDLKDYYYGYMVPNAGYLTHFSLHPFDQGLVLQMPDQTNPNLVPPFVPQKKLFQVLKESTRFGDVQQIQNVGQLNDQITHGNLAETILVEEALQEKKIAEMAAEIVSRPQVKFVLIAGPSSSGKTTFARRLSIQLRVNGLVPHPIGVDDYFKNREDTPKDANGNYNFECLEAIDTKQFNEDLDNLLKGKEIELPSFNFKTGKREYRGKKMQLKQNDILVIEGIHCLNDALTWQLKRENKYKIYISALTQLNIDEHNRIPSTDGRLLRRIVRDNRTRGISAKETIAMWPLVRKGEEQNIFPYQEQADAMFNSALIYELAVLKQYAEPALFGIDTEEPEYIEAKRLLKFLDYFVGFRSELVPMHSLLREFIGGGCFDI